MKRIIVVGILFLMCNIFPAFSEPPDETKDQSLQEEEDPCAELIKQARHEDSLFSAVLACELGLEDEDALAALDTTFPAAFPDLPRIDPITGADVPLRGFEDGAGPTNGIINGGIGNPKPYIGTESLEFDFSPKPEDPPIEGGIVTRPWDPTPWGYIDGGIVDRNPKPEGYLDGGIIDRNPKGIPQNGDVYDCVLTSQGICPRPNTTRRYWEGRIMTRASLNLINARSLPKLNDTLSLKGGTGIRGEVQALKTKNAVQSAATSQPASAAGRVGAVSPINLKPNRALLQRQAN